MEFSAGGSAPLVRLQRGGGSVDLTAPFTLPAPTLAADSATYAEVLPGVDLVVTAGADTVYERFVIKSAEAAANPALTSLRFTTRTSGLTLRSRTGGGVDAVDGRGTVVLTGPSPIMWDSAGVSAADVAPGSVDTPAVSRAGTAASEADPEDVENDEQPTEGDTVAPVGLSLDAHGLTLSPDLGVLRGEGTKYPVYLDPQLGGTRNGWAMVNKTYPKQEYWKWAGDSDDAEGLGHINDPLKGVHTKRLFFQYKTSSFNGKDILEANFAAFETHANSCDASKVEAWHVGGISTKTTWADQPSPVLSTSNGFQSSRTVALGRSGCTPGGGWVKFDVRAAVKYQTGKGAANTTIKLEAASETSNAGWKRFRKDATLTIKYNTRPARPSVMKMVSPSGTCPASATPFPNDPPQLTATFGDVDAGDTLTGYFELYNSAGTLLKKFNGLKPAARNTVQTWDLASANAYPLPNGLPDGVYKWRVQGKDSGGLFGPWTAFCTFSIDKKAPKAPSVTPDAATAAADADHPFPFGGTSSFTVTVGDASTKTYKWSVNSSVATSAAIAATAPTFTVPMKVYGPVTVRVWGYDAAGNASNPAVVEVPVGGFDLVRDTRARWRLDAATGSAVAPDAVGVTATTPNGASPLTLSGGAVLVDGGRQADEYPGDRALQLNAGAVTAATAATTSTAVVDLKKNLTVTAWVQLGSTAGRSVAVSHDAAGGSNLTIEQRTVSLKRPDPTTGVEVDVQEPHFVATVRVGSTEVLADVPFPVVTGEWYHVAASWAPGPLELTLAVAGVDGEEIDADSATASRDADAGAGVMRVGAGVNAAGTRGNYWPGLVDEVVVYSNILSPEELNERRRAPHG